MSTPTHQVRLAQALRAGLAMPKPDTGRLRAASVLASVRAARHEDDTAVTLFERAAEVAARVACTNLRRGKTDVATQYADAHALLLERADRARIVRLARVGWAA